MTPRYFAVVPAAGVGKRMAADRPKQYLPLLGRALIEHTLERLCAFSPIDKVVVALAPEDPYQAGVKALNHPRVMRCAGGAERCHSVSRALEALTGVAAEHDWVLVHDLARPCVRAEDLQRLLDQLQGHPVGGLLGVPVRDTMKRTAANGQVVATVERSQLWHAYTPQMFRYGLLRDALSATLARGELVTDEAAAIEAAGLQPLMVEGAADNIKVTRPEDLALAEFYIARQAAGES
ncbi:2-C-methyl-D-erythritol 4-phosphate cytidylyltransferase [Aestuariirhabdus litorea]|uniref:2-C-methyl-D-erythritol 4-phosphate cytidylyltransferase n=1 Tax=Aestuariirhabdus litorea TaxID=2528527 RepID=A0A3P3VXU1_9GAMM|nr:2-C-methyl-D-erythritol 4-phosphate cytidylyltransferase [Aestuariirhabdus litorea]RWW98712.1 2-C-methyl-D-erythritol 4-phosphate cytidylyltransferase [Endozoicomonadaceae bacterium GTF-13]